MLLHHSLIFLLFVMPPCATTVTWLISTFSPIFNLVSLYTTLLIRLKSYTIVHFEAIVNFAITASRHHNIWYAGGSELTILHPISGENEA